MRTSQPEPDDRDARAEANDPVWRLLERSPMPEPDAWFTVRTLARCRGAVPESRFIGAARLWRWMLGTGLGVSLAVLLLARSHSDVAAPDNSPGVQDAFEVLASFSDDSDSSSNSSSWQDTSL